MNNPTMSTKRRKCSGPSLVVESLPVDLLLEIVASADVATLIRCAATCRTLRRAILEPAFRRRLAANDGFDPALLLGVSHQEHAIHTTRPSMLSTILDDHILHAIFVPVASRDGLLVLRRLGDYDKVLLRACDIFTGHVTSLPPTAFPDVWLHVVLSVGGAGRSFELLVADMNERFFYQTFSSKDSKWSDIRQAKQPVPHPNRHCDSSCSAVISRTVHWPCRVDGVHWNQILALDVDAGEATVMELPPGCSSRNRLPLARVHGRLCLITEESQVITMWTLTSSVARTWSREVLISKLEIVRQVGLGANPSPTFILEGFGERSGAVMLNLLNNIYLLRFNLGIKEETPVITWLRKLGNAVVRVKELCLHEIDLISLLQAMKYF